MDDARRLAATVVPASTDGNGATGRSARLIEKLDPVEDFNFRHFRMRHMAAELLRTGMPQGLRAPDFELPSTDGGKLRLSDLRGQPVLLHFVSYTCPVTRGGITTMKELHRLFGDRVQFVEVLVARPTPASDTEPTARMGRSSRTPAPTEVKSASLGRCWSTTWLARCSGRTVAWRRPST